MATNFPGSLDSFTNPTSGSTLDSPSHAGQHANINDAMEAVQAKLGTGAGTIGEWTSYTPTFTNVTVGNGVTAFNYVRVNNMVTVQGLFELGSTSSISGDIIFSLPVTATAANAVNVASGVGRFIDVGVRSYLAWVQVVSTTTASVQTITISGVPYAGLITTSSTRPFSWTTSDSFRISLTYEAA